MSNGETGILVENNSVQKIAFSCSIFTDNSYDTKVVVTE